MPREPHKNSTDMRNHLIQVNFHPELLNLIYFCSINFIFPFSQCECGRRPESTNTLRLIQVLSRQNTKNVEDVRSCYLTQRNLGFCLFPQLFKKINLFNFRNIINMLHIKNHLYIVDLRIYSEDPRHSIIKLMSI